MPYPHQPGSPFFDGAEAWEAHQDDMEAAPLEEKVRWGFKGPRQIPLFMVWREYWHAGEVVSATVIWSTRDLRWQIPRWLGWR